MALFSVCSVYEVCRLVFLFYSFIYILCGVALHVALRRHWGGTLVAFTVFVLFMECWGWTFVAFTAFVAFIRRLG